MPTKWIQLAVGSGLAAATNGLFAKLTTTSLTSDFSAVLAGLLSLEKDNKLVEFVVRGTFFLLNLAFNAVMWGLFTAALAKGSSATKVSIVNTSSNFALTAIFGWVCFGESLKPGWWAGAALLVAGNIIIGRRDDGEGAKAPSDSGTAYTAVGTTDEDEQEEVEANNTLPYERTSQERREEDDDWGVSRSTR